MKKREITLPTILGLLITIGGLISGLWLLRGQLRQAALASAEEEPREVKVTNIDDDSFTVSWITEKAIPGFIQYKAEGVDQVVSDERDQQSGEIGSYFTHYVTINDLQPQVSYSFKIGSGKNIYGVADQDYQVSTAPTLDDQPAADVAFGSVLSPNREPAGGALVYIDIPGMVTQSALVKPSGAWVIPLATARTVDLAGFIDYDLQTTEMLMTVMGGPVGTVSNTLTSGNDSPVPEVILGQENDAGLDQAINNPQTTDLQILTPSNGEAVNTNQPEIIGQAPAGTEVTIEIHSDEAIVNVVQTDDSGRFNFSVPQGLTPGEHTVTVSAMIDGVLKTVSRSFSVYAAGESSVPFYSASPSATIVPRVTITPSSSVRPSPTLKPSPTIIVVAPSPTKTPTPTIVKLSPTPTPIVELVESGNGSITILGLMIGLGLMLTGGWWYNKAR